MKSKLFTLLFVLMANENLIYASDINIDGVLYDFNSSNKTATVTYMGTSYSAYSNEYTGSVSIPASVEYNGVTYAVTKIGTSAFRACKGLTSISVANGVTSIGDYAFYGCSGLTSITLGNSVTTISSNAFTGCKISSINYTSSIDNWCSKAWKPTVMASNYNLKINDVLQTTLTLPQSITTICSYAFSGCTSITSITIPEGVTSIGTYAFSSCKNLKTVSLPNTITSISQGTFKSSGVQSIDLPCSVKTIGEEAFSSCTSLQNINLNQTQTIGNYAFKYCSAIRSLDIPQSISNIGTNAFGGCTVLKNVYFNARYCNDFTDGSPFYDIRDVITSFDFGKDVISIPKRICEEMSKLSCISLPNNVTSVHAMAFSGCSNVKTIRLGCKISTVQSMVFYGCSSLTDVYIRNSVPCVLNNNGFQNVDVSSVNLWVPCGAKTAYQEASNWQNFGNIEEDYKGEGTCGSAGDNLTWKLCGGQLVVSGQGDMDNYSNTPAPWKTYRDSIEEIVIEEGVTSIGDYAFDWCSNVYSIKLPDGLLSIGESSFEGCSLLESILIPNSVTNLSTSAFSECYGLKDVAISNGMTSIGDYAFSDCTSLSLVSIPYGVINIGEGAFYGCTDLTSVTIPNSVTNIGEYAFEECTSLTVICNNAVSPQNINSNVFENVDKTLCTLYVPGESIDLYQTTDVWKDFDIRALSSSCVIAAGKCGTSGNNLKWELSCDSVLTISGSGKMGSYTSRPWQAYISGIKSIVIDKDVESVPHDSNYVNLESIMVAEDNAIYKTENGVLFGKKDKVLLYYPIAKKDSAYIIPNQTKAVAGDAFWGCKYLQSVSIPSSVQLFEDECFNECHLLRDVHVAWTSVPDRGFYWTNPSFVADYFGTGQPDSLCLHIPCGYKELYLHGDWKHGNLWEDCFKTIVEEGCHIITWANYDGTILKVDSLTEGKMPEYLGEPPTKPATEKYKYEFAGWTPEIVPVTDDATYTAVYDSVPCEIHYICYYNADSLLQTKVVNMCQPASWQYDGPIPFSCDTSSTYFMGWSTSQYTKKPVNTKRFVFTSKSWGDADSSWISLRDGIDYFTDRAGLQVTKGGVASAISKQYFTNVSSVELVYCTNIREGSGTVTISIGGKSLSQTINYISGNGYLHKSLTYDFQDQLPSGQVKIDASATEYSIYICEIIIHTIVYSSVINIDDLINDSVNYYALFCKRDTISSSLTFSSADFSETGTAGSGSEISSTKAGITLSLDKGYAGSPLRSYANGYISFSSVKPLRQITLRTNTKKGNVNNITLVRGGGICQKGADSLSIIWEGESAEVKFYMDAHVQFAEIIVTTNSCQYSYFMTNCPIVYNIDVSIPDSMEVHGTVIIAGDATYGDTITVTAVSDEGYHFDHWSDGNTDNPRDIVVEGDVDIYPIFVKNKYLIAFVNYNGAELQNSEVEHGEMPSYGGATPQKPASAEYTYTFSGWTPEIVPAADNATYTAKYDSTLIEYNIDVTIPDSVEAHGSVTIEGTTNYGDTITITATPEDGYVFEGWSDGNTDNPRAIVVGGDSTIYPIFFKKQYLIQFVNYDESVLQSGNVEHGVKPQYNGTTPTKPASKKYTYTFNGWSTEIVIATEPATYTAQYDSTLIEYEIHVTPEGGSTEGGTVTIDGDTNYGETVTLTPVPDEGYVFEQWSDGNTDNPRDIVVGGDSTIYPIFHKCEEIITLTEIVIGKGESYEFGGKTYSTRGIYYDTITLATGCDSISTLKLSVVKKKTFNLRAVVDSTQMAYGTAIGSGIYNDGQTVTIEAVPASSKYVFARWWNPDEGIEIFENPYTFTLTRNLTVKAVFKRAPKRIVVKQQGASHAMSHVETDIVAVIEVGEKMATVNNASESIYRIYDSAGHLVITSAEDNTYALPSGLYFIQIDEQSEKFIIQ